MKHADLIILNAKIYTLDADNIVREAMAIKDGKILATGNHNDITGNYKSVEVIDLEGKAVYPGFIDAHCHFYSYGLGLLQRADLTGSTSFDDVLEIIQVHHAEHPSAWVIGRGWDQNDWEVKEFPTKEKLDQLFPDHPVLLTRIDGHAAIVNAKALEIAGINNKTRINGGEILLAGGQPTGVLIDNAIDLVTARIPEPTDDEIMEALLLAEKRCFEAGLTGVHDAGLDKKVVTLIDRMQKEGRLKMKVYAMLSPTKENFEAFIQKGVYKTDRLTVRSVKLYADGALGSRGARLMEDYSDDPGNSGLILTSPEKIREWCHKAYDNGYQVCTHAIGDSANRLMLNIYSEFLKGNNDLRWRIEHAQIVAESDFSLFGKYCIIPSVQPTHATSDMYWATDRVGDQRVKGAYAYKHLLDENHWIPLGTDFPIENINPLFTFYAATERKDLKGWPENGFQTEQALTREQALKGMTIWAAKVAFEESEKGTLEPGKAADFVVLDKNIMEVTSDELPTVKVLRTFVNGEEVFKMEK